MKHALIITHCGSGATVLCRILATSMKVRCFGKTGVNYSHPLAIQQARQIIDQSLNLKSSVNNDWYIDKLMFNYEFTCKNLYSICKFIYMIRSPQVPLSTLISKGYSPEGAETHYLFRLRRMCEMSKKSGGILITYEDLVNKSAFSLLQNSLDLKSPLSSEFVSLHSDDLNLANGKIIKDPIEPGTTIPEDVLERCVSGYNIYLNFMEKKTGLLRFVV